MHASGKNQATSQKTFTKFDTPLPPRIALLHETMPFVGVVSVSPQ